MTNRKRRTNRGSRVPLSSLQYSIELPHCTHTHLDSTHVGKIATSLRRGDSIPPILVDQNTQEVVDGFARAAAVELALGVDAMVNIEYQTFAGTKEKLLEFGRRNRHAKRALTREEQFLLVTVCVELGGTAEEALDAIGRTIEWLFEQRRLQARARGTGEPIPVKTPTERYGACAWTKNQHAASKRIGGAAIVQVRQLLLHLNNFGLKGWTEEELIELDELAQTIAALRL